MTKRADRHRGQIISRIRTRETGDLRGTMLSQVAISEIADAQVDRNPKGHDPAEGRGRNDESQVAATSGDAPEGS